MHGYYSELGNQDRIGSEEDTSYNDVMIDKNME